jgi:WD40 repeat protein
LILWLKLISENAKKWKSFDTIESIEKNYLGVSNDLDNQINLLFLRLSAENNHGKIFVKNILHYLTLSRSGTSEQEIKNLMWRDPLYIEEFKQRKHKNQPEVDSIPQIIISRFMSDFHSYLAERKSGSVIVYNFFHLSFKRALLKSISDHDRIYYHEKLADYFSDNSKEPLYFLSELGEIVYNVRRLTELPFNQAHSGDLKGLERTLTDIEFLDAKANIGKVVELGIDFEIAKSKDLNKKYLNVHLIGSALKNDITFIERHPNLIFQCLYNSCWWFDCNVKEKFYESYDIGKYNNNLHSLLEEWEMKKSSIEPGFYWLRSLSPTLDLEGPQIGLFRGLSSPVNFVSFSKDETKINGICNRGELIIWNKDSYELEKYIPFQYDRSFMFKPNSKKKFNTNTEIKRNEGGEAADHPGFEYWAWSGAISTDGKIFLSGSEKGNLKKYNLENFSSIPEELILPNLSSDEVIRPVRGLSIAENQKYAVSGHGNGTIFVWDLISNSIIQIFSHDEGWVNSVAISSNGDTIVSGGGDGILYLWKLNYLNNDYSSVKLIGHTDRIWSVTISNDGKLAASGSDDKSVRIWDLTNSKELVCLFGHTRWVQALSLSNDNKFLASSGGDGKIFIWNIISQNPEPIEVLEGHDDSVLSLSFSKDGTKILSASRDQTVRIWELNSGKKNVKQIGHSDRITSVDFSKDRKILVTGSADKNLFVWNTHIGYPLGKVLNVNSPIRTIRIGFNGRLIAIGTDSGEVLIADLQKGEILNKLNRHKEKVYSVDISKNEKYLLTSSADGLVCLWDIGNYEILCEIILSDDFILSLAFSPKGGQFALANKSGSVEIYEIVEGLYNKISFKKKIFNKVFPSWAEELVYSNDGKYLEIRGGTWEERRNEILEVESLNSIDKGSKKSYGSIGSFGKYKLQIGKTEVIVHDSLGSRPIAYYPKTFEFVKISPNGRQWVGIQRYNIHHFRLEGGI